MKDQNNKTNHNSKRTWRFIKWLSVIIIAIALLILGFKPRPIEVDLAELKHGQMTVTVNDDGETRVRERYTISAPLPGQLLRINLDPGDIVGEKDIVAVINSGAPTLLDPRTLAQAQAVTKSAEAAVNRALSQLDACDADLEQTEKAFKRNQILHKKGSVSSAALEESQRAYLAAKYGKAAAISVVDMSKYDLEQSRAALRRIQDWTEDGSELQSFTISSPITGSVLRVHEESSRMVPAGTALLDIGDPADLEMRIDVLSQDAVRIKPGQKVIIEEWGGTQDILGRVRLVEPSAYTKVSALGVDEQRVDVIADFETEEQIQEVGARYRIEAKIVVWEKDDVLQVPVGALFRHDGKWAVYEMIDNSAHLSLIEIGQNNGEFAEVLDGLRPEAQVILHPGDRVQSGTKIRPSK